MRELRLMAWVMIAGLAASTALAGQMEGPGVTSAGNPSPRLMPGGPGVTVNLTGTNLDRITSARVLQNGQPVSDVTITLGPVAATTRSVTLKALAGAPARTGLVIRISDGRQSFDIPPRIIQVAVGPAQPVNTLGPVDTSPRLIDTTKTPAPGPVVSSLAVNNGAASTASTRVSLNMSVQGASFYRASENAVFTGATWQTWTVTAVPPFDLSPGNGTKTVYVQVKNTAGTISPTVSDSITLNAPPPPTRQDYTVTGVDAYNFSMPQGYKFSFRLEQPLNQLGFLGPEASGLDCYTQGKPINAFGSRCDFVLFDGRELNPGWIIKSYHATFASSSSSFASGRVDERPTAGGRAIRFKIHLWCERENWSRFVLHHLVLEGPANADWREAFR